MNIEGVTMVTSGDVYKEGVTMVMSGDEYRGCYYGY